MTTYYNPALQEEPQNQPAKVVSVIPRESLLSWLESTGRFYQSDVDEFSDHKMPETLDDILEPDIYVLEQEEDQFNSK